MQLPKSLLAPLGKAGTHTSRHPRSLQPHKCKTPAAWVSPCHHRGPAIGSGLLLLLSPSVMSHSATLWTIAWQTSLSFTISRVCSNPCPLSRCYHPTNSSSVIPFSSCLQSFPASGSFPVSQLFASGWLCVNERNQPESPQDGPHSHAHTQGEPSSCTPECHHPDACNKPPQLLACPDLGRVQPQVSVWEPKPPEAARGPSVPGWHHHALL